jgi:hypothetical protein
MLLLLCTRYNDYLTLPAASLQASYFLNDKRSLSLLSHLTRLTIV